MKTEFQKMKLFAAVVMVGASVCAISQQPCVGGEHPNNAPDCIPASEWVKQYQQPAPLKCGKYQYVKTDDYVYVDDCRFMAGGILACSPPKPRCEDKIYPMTLAEYEQIMARLKALEHKEKP